MNEDRREAPDTAAKLVREYFEDCEDETALTADGFDEAVVGIAHRFHGSYVAYDYDMCIKILVRDGMTWDEAEEYFQFNTLGAWVGEGTPVFIKFFTDRVPSAEPEGGAPFQPTLWDGPGK